MTTHLAATSLAKGQPFELQARLTPKPGPNELLIAVKSVALNPADVHMRDKGLFIPSYPTVIGFDIAGLVLEVGENVPTASSTTSTDDKEKPKKPGPTFLPGVTRVAAYCTSVWKRCDPDYGAFQERCLVPWQHAVPLPDKSISWNEAATLPVAVEVPLSAWDMMGISSFSSSISSPRTRNDKNYKKEALLIWGAASSVGTMGIQSAGLLRDDHDSSFAAVYATASPANHAYTRSLGADRVFDYHNPQVVDAIISAAREDGLVIRHCFLATGDLAPCQGILKNFIGKDGQETAKIGSAPIIPPDADEVDGVETIFVMPSMADEGERLEQFRYWFGTWLREKLKQGRIKPSPEARVVGRGLEAINQGLDLLCQGVSCTKLVVEVAE